MDTDLITTIENIVTNKKIILTKLLSSAFNINCLKIVTEDNEKFVVKYYEKKIMILMLLNQKQKISYFSIKKK